MRATFHRHLLRPAANGAVVSVGVFDGVHVGHLAILAENVARAKERGCEPTVVTFRRHPKRLLLGRAPKSLTTLDHRMALFERAGVEHVVALKFDERMRATSAEEFARDILANGLDAKHLVLGFDSKFGAGRRGTPEWLREQGWSVDVVEQVLVGKRPVSSTAIREAVELGDLEAASQMLGRPVSVLGRVVHGSAIGRSLGFPTANLNLMHELHPPNGVYAARTRRITRGRVGPQRDAVVNIGRRPTVERDATVDPRVEVHLLDWEGSLYGDRLEVEFVARLRTERRFEDRSSLEHQIARDVVAAREVLAQDAAAREDGRA
ncbi:MAG: riboflavin biosynthesis protein RibF [Planctomycetota bacterium]